jgi:hypothetical protein
MMQKLTYEAQLSQNAGMNECRHLRVGLLRVADR